MSRLPSHLVFDEEPRPQQLVALLGPVPSSVRAQWLEDDEQIRIAPRRVPVLGVVAFLVSFAATLTSAPLWLPHLGYELPAHVASAVLWTLAAAIWLLVVPGVFAILWLVQRAADAIGPGAVVDKSSRELALPWIDRVVPRHRLVRFVLLRGRSRKGSSVEPFAQSGVLFRDDDDRFVYAPFARLFAARLARSPAQRLADYYDLPLQQLDAGAL